MSETVLNFTDLSDTDLQIVARRAGIDEMPGLFDAVHANPLSTRDRGRLVEALLQDGYRYAELHGGILQGIR